LNYRIRCENKNNQLTVKKTKENLMAYVTGGILVSFALSVGLAIGGIFLITAGYYVEWMANL
jgi:hypothetical protein